MSRLTYTADMASDTISEKIPAGIVEHYCEHPGCTSWGGLGFAASTSMAVRWWCARHYPYWPDDVKAKYAALPA